MFQFLNRCLKQENSPDGYRLKFYTKASSLNADRKYVRPYHTQVTKHETSKVMGETVRTVFSLVSRAMSTRLDLITTAGHGHLVDKRVQDKQQRENYSSLR